MYYPGSSSVPQSGVDAWIFRTGLVWKFKSYLINRDASVPFKFDVHALFFSDDAVSVEAELHHRFADKRVNRINTRREFFYATPAEVREALKDIAGNLLEFTEEPEAEQYRLSLEEVRASALR